MTHPRMFRDDDPYLANLRAICLALPETDEYEPWGRATFRAGKKIFATFTGSLEDRFAVIFKPEPGERRALIADPRFFAPAYWGQDGWLALDLAAAPVEWDEVAELVEGSYRQVALKRMLRALDDA